MKNQKLISEKNNVLINFVVILFLMLLCWGCSSEDERGWHTYRHDSSRSGVTDESLPSDLSLKWIFKPTHSPVTAWHKPGEELPRMHADNAYHVVSAHGMTCFGSSVDDKLYALNTNSGEIEWTFFADGPIRFAPSIWRDRIYFGSDDGYVYCLNLSNGALIWKHRAGPSDKKIIGNGRMISLWPVRTSILVEDGVVYFGAGVFPYEGIYIYALDADNGEVIWKNDTIGDKAHELPFGGISPHGYLLSSEEMIYIPSGRSMPAAFNKNDGKFLYALSPGSKAGGTWGLIDNDKIITGVERSGTPTKITYDLETGRRLGDAYISFDGIDMVTQGDISFVVTEEGIHAIKRDQYPLIEKKIDSLLAEIKIANSSLRRITHSNIEKKNNTTTSVEQLITKIESLKSERDQLQDSSTRWQFDAEGLKSIILAKNQIIAGGKGSVMVLNATDGQELHRFSIKGNALGLAVASSNLLVSNEKGYLYCFTRNEDASIKNNESVIENSPFFQDELTDFYASAADQLLKETGIYHGYCLVLASAEGQLALEMAKRSELKIVGIDSDQDQIDRARQNLNKAGLYGKRIIIENWSLENLPDYFANLIVSDEFLLSGEINAPSGEIARILKPFGGMVCLGQPSDDTQSIKPYDEASLKKWLGAINNSIPEKSDVNGQWLKIRRGALAGAGSWTHQYANPANTICSDDELVNYSFGILWYGEPGPARMVERHAKAAAPVANNGRLFIQGENVVMAYDSYNGLKLWEREIPGANRVRVDVDGGNLALSDQGIFVAVGETCLLLDAVSGQTLKTFKVPTSSTTKPRRWGYIACLGNTLYGSAAKPFDHDYDYLMSSLKKADNLDQQDQTGLFPEFASEEALTKEFQRSGTKWRYIADYPTAGGGIVTQEPATEKLMFSDAVFAIDISTGQTKWVHKGQRIAHITISMGDGTIYFADKGITSAQKLMGIKDRKQYKARKIWKAYREPITDRTSDVRLVTALSAGTGRIKWQRSVDLAGCGGDAVASAYNNKTLLFLGSFGLHDKWRFTADELRWHRITALDTDKGQMLWSRPLNYMVRPLIIDNTVIVEPRACDLRTGEIKTRIHPITGRTVPWEYYRPGHTCAITSATSTCLFYRSYNAAFYDLAGDRGISYFGAIRPGCWINMIPANGLLLFPEASAGCTCSFPLRTTVVLKPEQRGDVGDWTVYITQGPITPVKRLGINLGAPGDKKDEQGALWLGYPRPITGYGIRFDLQETIQENMGYYAYDPRGVKIEGTDKPWLYTSGCVGLMKARIPLLDEAWSVKPGYYTVRMGFFAPGNDRIFHIKLQGETALENFNPGEERDDNNQIIIKQFNHVEVEGNLLLELVPLAEAQHADEAAVINFIEIIREDKKEQAIHDTKSELLSKNEGKHLLKQAESKRRSGNTDEALNHYHMVLEKGNSDALKKKALSGMAMIGSTKSLPFIESFVRQTEPIYWDYNEPDENFVDSAIEVYVSIANNIAKAQPHKAHKMLVTSAERSSGFELKDKIMASLLDLGVDSEMPIVKEEELQPGIHYKFFEGNFTSVASLDNAKSSDSGIMTGIRLEEPEGVSEYGYIFNGYLSVPKDGIYTFFLESNDGSKLYIDGKEIVNNDGAHGAKEESGNTSLRKGYHPLVVKYFQMGGGQELKVSWEGVGFEKREIVLGDIFYLPTKN